MSDVQLWERICVIDTENASGSLYVGTQIGTVRIGEYLTIPLEPPFSAARYLEAIDLAEQNGVEFLIIDSLSHAWSGEGGLLDVQANIAKRTGNGYTAWRDVTPQHNRLVDRILQCNMHIAATLRTKTEYVIEDNACPKCGSRDLDYATRIIGYLKLISRFAHDRQIEANKRHYSHGLEEHHESETES